MRSNDEDSMGNERTGGEVGRGKGIGNNDTGGGKWNAETKTNTRTIRC